MRLAFSTSACPGWDLATVLQKARAVGYGGVEIRGLAGKTYLPTVTELAGDPAATRRRFDEAGVKLVALDSEACFHWPDRQTLVSHKQRVREYVELAEQLGCSYVAVSAGEVPPKRHITTVLAQVAEVLGELAAFAAEHDVRLAVANSPGLASSRDLWFLLDALNTPAVRACWDPCVAMTVRERPTVSIPRLNSKIGLVHVSDGRFASDGQPSEFVLPGEGEVGWERCVDLLRGLGFAGWLIFDCPSPCPEGLADPEKTLPTVAEFLRKQVERVAKPQEAKGDK